MDVNELLGVLVERTPLSFGAGTEAMDIMMISLV